jgi:hypothetical protein
VIVNVVAVQMIGFAVSAVTVTGLRQVAGVVVPVAAWLLTVSAVAVQMIEFAVNVVTTTGLQQVVGVVVPVAV